MYSFLNDYSETAHPAVLKAILDTNLEQCVGYGMDEHCQNAIRLIKEKMNWDSADIHFIPGGTQANLLATAAFLRPNQAVICADSGHIHCHECASVEATGHKLLVEPTADGKLTVELVDHAVKANSEEYTPRPKMVYISNSTELGTVYSKQELNDLYAYCREHKLIFFIDGARMASALDCSDLSFADYPRTCDAFYIGGTKNGAFLGEAMVLVRDDLKEDFRQHMKQRGAMLAKGKILGIQFEELFRGGLYMELARHANQCMEILRKGIAQKGYSFLVETPSNQIFPIFPGNVLKEIQENYMVTYQQDMGGDNHCVRMVTSWATDPQQCRNFVEQLTANN